MPVMHNTLCTVSIAVWGFVTSTNTMQQTSPPFPSATECVCCKLLKRDDAPVLLSLSFVCSWFPPHTGIVCTTTVCPLTYLPAVLGL